MDVLALEEELRCKLILYSAGLIPADQVAEAAFALVVTEAGQGGTP